MIRQNDRVRHPSKPEWGLGRVLATLPNGSVRVLFEHTGEKLIRPEIAGLIVVPPEEARSARLDNVRVDREGHAARTTSLEDLVSVFRESYPGGFSDPKYLADERNYKVAAHNLAVETLSAASLGAAFDAGDSDEVCRRARHVIDATNLLFRSEKIALRNALEPTAAREHFASALAALLHGDEPFTERFGMWVGVLTDLGARHWTTATYFPFLVDPVHHMFMKPRFTARVADACGFELNYRVEPNPTTYECLTALAAYLAEALAGLEPRDFLDVQSFVWVVAQRA